MGYNTAKLLLPTLGLALGLGGCASSGLEGYMQRNESAEMRKYRTHSERWKANRAEMKLVDPTAVSLFDGTKVARTEQVFPGSKYSVDRSESNGLHEVLNGSFMPSYVVLAVTETGTTCRYEGPGVSRATMSLNQDTNRKVTGRNRHRRRPSYFIRGIKGSQR